MELNGGLSSPGLERRPGVRVAQQQRTVSGWQYRWLRFGEPNEKGALQYLFFVHCRLQTGRAKLLLTGMAWHCWTNRTASSEDRTCSGRAICAADLGRETRIAGINVLGTVLTSHSGGHLLPSACAVPSRLKGRRYCPTRKADLPAKSDS